MGGGGFLSPPTVSHLLQNLFSFSIDSLTMKSAVGCLSTSAMHITNNYLQILLLLAHLNILIYIINIVGFEFDVLNFEIYHNLLYCIFTRVAH